MRRKVHPGLDRSNREPRILEVSLEASRMVTLEHPNADLESARGAFCRLRPPEGTSATETASWRERVTSVARAVTVLSAPKAAEVPAASAREAAPSATFREAALELATETGDKNVLLAVGLFLDKAGA